MKKLVIFIMVLFLTIGLGAKGQQEKGLDVVTVMTWDTDDAAYSFLDGLPIIQYVEEKLNIKIEWRLYPHGEEKEAINLLIAGGGEMPDIFPAQGNPKYLEEKGIIVPWSDFMDAGKMPLTVAKLNDPKYLSIKNQLIDEETGKMYTLGSIPNHDLMIWSDYIRSDWLEKVGIKKDPETVEEYRDMLRAFKTMDPNGNGKQDEIPWQNFYNGVTWVKMWSRMFGLPTPDYSLSTVDTLYWAIINGDEVVFAPTDERFLAMLKYLNSLWTERLINQDQFNMTSPRFNATVSNNTLGTQNMWPVAITGMTEKLREIEPNAQWHAIPYVIDSRFMKAKDRKYAKSGAVHQQVMLAKNGKNIEAAVRLVDFTFGNEDFVFTIEYGIEGVHHEIDSEGNAYYIGEWAEMDPITRHNALGSAMGHLPHEKKNFGLMQRLKTDPIFDDFKAYMVKIGSYEKPSYLWKLTQTQKDIAKTALKEIKTFVDESITKFIIGTKLFSEWDEYVETVNKEAGDKIGAARQMYQEYFDKNVKKFW